MRYIMAIAAAVLSVVFVAPARAQSAPDLSGAKSSTTKPRPVWIVAHMCNSPRYILDALANGANGVECDIECEQAGGGFAFEVHHGFAGPGYDPAKANARTPLDVYLKAVHDQSQAHPGYVRGKSWRIRAASGSPSPMTCPCRRRTCGTCSSRAARCPVPSRWAPTRSRA